jgi:hypothetical protein
MNTQDAKLVIYADDTNVSVTDNDKEDLQAKLSSVMKQLEAWFLNNDLIVNTTKTVAMPFHLCQSKPPYKLNILLQNNEITYMSEVKFLGMCIMENLSWQAHIRFLCHSLSKAYYMIIIKEHSKHPNAMGYLLCPYSMTTEIWHYAVGRNKRKH